MAQRPTSRREFLQGVSAAEAVHGVEGHSAGELAKPPRAAATLTLTRRAMACDFQVRLNATAEQNETEAALAALDVIEAVEDRLSVYKPDTEVMELNRQAAEGPVAVAADLFGLLQQAARLYRDTGGAYDITSGPLSRVWGFSRREGRMPTEQLLLEALEKVGGRFVALDESEQTVEFLREAIEINFNSVGKGFALDRAAESLQEEGVEDFLLHGGRSTLVARGAAADGDPKSIGWGVGVRHPLRPEQRLAECRLVDAAFSTSGSATQCFTLAGRRFGHLLDPRTGWPAEGLHSVSVLAPTGAEADALSTAFYVMGFPAAEAYCRTRPEVQALFVLPAESASDVLLKGVNLSGECWHILGEALSEDSLSISP